MNQNQTGKSDLIDTTDCLEAVGVFRGWKNGLFVVIALCLLLLQVSFWLVDRGFIEVGKKTKSETSVVAYSGAKEATEKAAVEPNKVKSPMPQCPQRPGRCLLGITFDLLSWVIGFVNAVLVLAATLYCLTMLFSLKISLVGRLGGISHISRAFFLSLVAMVLLVPWQLVFGFGTAVVGVTYTPNELVKWYTVELTNTLGIVLYYLRFSGYWLLVVLLLIFSQVRSARWAKTILRRLEVV